MVIVLRTFFLLFFLLPSLLFGAKSEYILKEGFIYHKTNIATTSPYQKGVLSLYYSIEQNFSVSPLVRNYCVGQQKVLFEIEFDTSGAISTIRPFERYNWYNIDVKARVIVTDLLEVIVTDKNWNTSFKGTLYFPLRFYVSATGRVHIDYSVFSRTNPRTVRLGTI